LNSQLTFVDHIVMIEIMLSGFLSLIPMNYRLFILGLKDAGTFPEEFSFVVYFMTLSLPRLVLIKSS
jgi:hypothetical protein